MKVLFVRCPPISINNYPPDIGLVYIASYVAALGYESAVIDANIEVYQQVSQAHKEMLKCSNLHSFSEEEKDFFTPYASFWEEIEQRIETFNPDVIGFNVWNSNAAASVRYAKRLKGLFPQAKIIFGGPECYPLLSGISFAKESCIDVVVYGEAELTIEKVLESMRHRGSFSRIPGIIVNTDGHIHDNGWGDYIKDPDTLPDMRLDLFPVAFYHHLPLSFNRGCLHSCNYCPRRMYPRVRFRSVERIFHEIELLVTHYPEKKRFCLCDASATDSTKQLLGVSERIIVAGLHLDIGGCFASPNPALTPALLTQLKKAGFAGFCYGVETGSPRLNRMFEKNISIEDIERVIRQTYEAGLDVTIVMMVGFPGESEEDFKASLDFLVRNRQYITGSIGINECELLPYSYLWDHVDEFNIIPAEIKRERHYRMKSLIDSFDIAEAQKYNYTPGGQR